MLHARGDDAFCSFQQRPPQGRAELLYRFRSRGCCRVFPACHFGSSPFPERAFRPQSRDTPRSAAGPNRVCRSYVQHPSSARASFTVEATVCVSKHWAQPRTVWCSDTVSEFGPPTTFRHVVLRRVFVEFRSNNILLLTMIIYIYLK